MVLWLCAHLPQLPLDALRPGSLNALPMLVWQGLGADQSNQRTVMTLNAAAQDAGLAVGMRLSTAQALAPQVLIRTRDRALEAQFLAELALALGALSPKLTIQAPDVLLEIGSCLRLFGGARRLQRLAGHIAADCGAQVHWGLASTPLAARLFARTPRPAWVDRSRLQLDAAARIQTRSTRSASAPPTSPLTTPLGTLRPWPRCVQATSTQRHLHRLPLTQLACVAELDAATLTMFQSLGVHDLAALHALPRAGLARRGAQAWLDALDRARGSRPDPQTWFEPPEQFETGLELQQRTDNAETLAVAAALLLQPLAGWLTLRWQAAQRLRLVLQHEKRLHAHLEPERPDGQDPSRDSLQLDLAAPSRDAKQLAVLLRERLSRHPLRAPVYGLRLVLELSVAHAGHPGALIADERERQRDLGVLIERLRARLGADRVLQLVPVDDARPERADTTRPATPEALANAAQPARKGNKRSRSGGADSRATKPALNANRQTPQDASIQTDSPTPATDTAALSPPAAPNTLPRPTWLLHEALRLDDDNGVPLQEDAPPAPGSAPHATRTPRPSRAERRLLLLSKAERIETGWFDGHLVRRDYHVALGRDGVLRWVYVERAARAPAEPDALAEPAAPRWFLHGLFG